MKLIILWLANTIFVLPLKVITILFKIIYTIIKNIYFNNLDLEYINNMDGHDFEYLTKLLLEKNGYKQVSVSQSSSDFGIDVFASKNKITYAIQCKRYSKPVGIKAIQEAKSGCDYYNCDIPVVFTNTTFSPAAFKLAKTIDVELWDKDTLYHYLKKAKILSKSLPFYYPLISFIATSCFGYLYYLYLDNYWMMLLLISSFLFLSIIVKIFKDKTKAPLITKEPQYTIHDYRDTIK